MQVTLIFGGNQGDRAALINEAIQDMTTIGKIIQRSSLYETAPWGFDSRDSFYNQVVIYETRLSPEEVLVKCQSTETRLGRKRSGVQFCSRTIDIDILFFGSQIMETPTLIVPHPRLTLRNFVLVPLNEVMPDFIHPVSGKKISELLAESPDTLNVFKICTD